MYTRTLLLAAAVAAVTFMAPSAVRADETVTTVTSTTSTVTPIAIVSIADAPTGPNGEPIDYSLLLIRNFNYTDLAQAHAQGYSDHEIAVMAKIADRAGVPFQDVDRLAQDGLTFVQIADRYGVLFGDIMQVRDYEDKVYAYKLAYQNTGERGYRNMVAAEQQLEITTPAGVTTTTNVTTTTTPSSNTTVSPNGTTTTVTPNTTTTVSPNGTTIVAPN
jgi:hypothetical protein